MRLLDLGGAALQRCDGPRHTVEGRRFRAVYRALKQERGFSH